MLSSSVRTIRSACMIKESSCVYDNRRQSVFCSQAGFVSLCGRVPNVMDHLLVVGTRHKHTQHQDNILRQSLAHSLTRPAKGLSDVRTLLTLFTKKEARKKFSLYLGRNMHEEGIIITHDLFPTGEKEREKESHLVTYKCENSSSYFFRLFVLLRI